MSERDVDGGVTRKEEGGRGRGRGRGIGNVGGLSERRSDKIAVVARGTYCIYLGFGCSTHSAFKGRVSL